MSQFPHQPTDLSEPGSISAAQGLASPEHSAKPAMRMSGWLLAGLFTLGVACSTTAAIAASKYLMASHQTQYAVLDLNDIVEEQQLVIASDYLSADGGSPQAQQKVASQVEALGRSLEKEIAGLREECGCILLTKAAVIGDGPQDLTEVLRKRMGLGKVDRAALQAKVNAAMTVKLPESLGRVLNASNQADPRQ